MLANYYIDAVNGNDSNLGSSPQESWASLNRLYSNKLLPGDHVFLSRGSNWTESLIIDAPGTSAQPIVVTAFGQGAMPTIRGLSVYAANVTVEELIVDRAKESGDAVRVRNAHDVVLRNMEVRNGVSDGIDGTDVDGLLIEGLTIHHFLAGSFTDQRDAHGIVVSATQGITIRDTEIHHVSGDSFQADPNRDPAVTTDIVIERCHFWTSPLLEDFNGLWFAGERPGENAIDTKVATTNWESAERMRITVRDTVAHGWVRDGYISNRAVFNMKEKVEAVFDGVTVYDSEIAFRLRGTRGNANTTLKNAVVYEVEKAVRAEDDLSNLKVLNSTFGDQIGQTVQFAGGDGGKGTWDWSNNAFLSAAIPSIATQGGNRVASTDDFVDVPSNDYRLSAQSALIDSGIDLSGLVNTDRDGITRPQGGGFDVGAHEQAVVATTPPKVEAIVINGGDSQRSITDTIAVWFDTIIGLDDSQNDLVAIKNLQTQEFVRYQLNSSVADGKTVLSLSFLEGPSVEVRNDASNTLADGNYQLTINAMRVDRAGVLLDGNSDGTAGDDFVFGDDDGDRLFRLYGDTDGDRDVDGQDYGRFGMSFMQDSSSSVHEASLDNDGDGDIDGKDYGRFELNFLKSLPG